MSGPLPASHRDDSGSPPDPSFLAALDEFAAIYRTQWPQAEIFDETQQNVPMRRVRWPELRPPSGNHPKVLHHGKRQANVVVLMHGITDSPHYMEAIGRRLHSWGFNVVLPLLPAHGLREPWPAMQALEHTHWITHVDRIVDVARRLGDRLSLGGFSTGGALTVHKVTRHPDMIDGGLLLFSPALEIDFFGQALLQSDAGELIGRLKDHRNHFLARLRKAKSDRRRPQHPRAYGIGMNPFKYSVFFYEGAAELAEVIQEINEHYDRRRIERYSDIMQPLFVAHSPIDESAEFEGAKRIVAAHPKPNFAFFDAARVPHASLVLDKRIDDVPDRQADSEANRLFDEMVGMLETFAERHLGVARSSDA